MGPTEELGVVEMISNNTAMVTKKSVQKSLKKCKSVRKKEWVNSIQSIIFVF